MEPIQTALVKETADAALEQAKGFLGKLLGPAFDEAGLILQERVRQYRLSNQIKILEKSQRMLADAGLTTKAVSLKTLLPLLENASLEQEQDLQSKWAALLANASAGSAEQSVLPSFVDILRQLSVLEARLLDALHNRVFEEMRRVYETVDVSSVPYIGAAGVPHDTLGQLFVAIGLGTPPWVPLREHVDREDQARIDANRVGLSMALDNLIRLGIIYREPGTKYRDKFFLSTFGCQFVRACRAPQTK